jgi:alkanesulfonate monooxygenase SsuD/methylene tetrahydromethanopterin reductase-like flavin-dependent oxidoreductase (luciferase family)
MHFGLEIIPLGPYSNPPKVVELAQAAEAAGWEGIWLWDHILFPYGVGDPWITLAAVAGATTHLKLCTGVSPIPRYRPHLLARMLTSLDILSAGRVIFGTGLGVAFDFVPFGEASDDKTHAEMTDEGLELLSCYLSGEETTHHGKYYNADKVRLVPSPVQKPHIPVLVGGDSPAGMRRAARWDGWIMGTVDEQQKITKTPAQVASQVAYIRQHRSAETPFNVAVDGVSKAGSDGALAREYEGAGATWWFEAIFGTRGSEEEMLGRVKAGPPG